MFMFLSRVDTMFLTILFILVWPKNIELKAITGLVFQNHHLLCNRTLCQLIQTPYQKTYILLYMNKWKDISTRIMVHLNRQLFLQMMLMIVQSLIILILIQYQCQIFKEDYFTQVNTSFDSVFVHWNKYQFFITMAHSKSSMLLSSF